MFPRKAWKMFLELSFSCEEAALVASSHCTEGPALTYCILLLSMDALAATVLSSMRMHQSVIYNVCNIICMYFLQDQ